MEPLKRPGMRRVNLPGSVLGLAPLCEPGEPLRLFAATTEGTFEVFADGTFARVGVATLDAPSTPGASS